MIIFKKYISRKRLGNKILDILKCNSNNKDIRHVLFIIVYDLLGNDLAGTIFECGRENEFKDFLVR